jgi:Trypsin
MKKLIVTSWAVMLVLQSDARAIFCAADTNVVATANGDAASTPKLSSSVTDPVKPRIIDGVVSDPGARTFYVRSGFDQYYWTPEMLCGATLIHSDVIVTAAHCSGAFNYGALLYDPTSNDFSRTVPVDRQLRHPQWNFDNSKLNFDILVRKPMLLCHGHFAGLCYHFTVHYPVRQSLKSCAATYSSCA